MEDVKRSPCVRAYWADLGHTALSEKLALRFGQEPPPQTRSAQYSSGVNVTCRGAQDLNVGRFAKTSRLANWQNSFLESPRRTHN
jgi:hypothetical protein